MRASLARQAARWSAVLLVGVGAGGLAGLVGLAGYAAAIGALTAIGCAGFVGMTILGWNAAVVQEWTSRSPFQGYELLTPGLFRAVALGFLGTGFVAGSMSAASPVLLVPGIAGLVVLALTRGRSR